MLLTRSCLATVSISDVGAMHHVTVGKDSVVANCRAMALASAHIAGRRILLPFSTGSSNYPSNA
eukprot:11290719-Alexandrium_andersonii.AAC.1